MPIYGKRPDDVVADRYGNATTGTPVTLHATEADALADANPLESTTTEVGSWTADVPVDEVWVRVVGDKGPRVYQIITPAKASDVTDLAGRITALETAPTPDLDGGTL
jgi:hypothetical protein